MRSQDRHQRCTLQVKVWADAEHISRPQTSVPLLSAALLTHSIHMTMIVAVGRCWEHQHQLYRMLSQDHVWRLQQRQRSQAHSKAVKPLCRLFPVRSNQTLQAVCCQAAAAATESPPSGRGSSTCHLRSRLCKWAATLAAPHHDPQPGICRKHPCYPRECTLHSAFCMVRPCAKLQELQLCDVNNDR